jgi:hypothetical protein
MLLICADLVFIALHSINGLTSILDNRLFSFERDGSYPEVYQYIKWFWLIVLMLHISISRRSYAYLAWGLVFAYFLVDDALMIHERVGRIIAGNLAIRAPFGLRLQDLGEVAVSATAGVILLAVVGWAYWHGSQAFKKVSQDLLPLILALVFFGVGMDLVHVAIRLGWTVNFVLGVIEDGGQTLVASLIVWYVFLLAVRDKNATLYLSDCIRAALKR